MEVGCGSCSVVCGGKYWLSEVDGKVIRVVFGGCCFYYDGVMSYNIGLDRVGSCCIVLVRVVSCCVVLYRVVSCCIVLYRVVSCSIWLHRVVS